MTRGFDRVAVVLALLFSTSASAQADVSDFDLDAAPAKGEELARCRSEVEFAFASLKASRELLRRGRYGLVEQRVETDAGARQVFDIESTTGFDLDRHMVRVELSQTSPFPYRFTYVEGSNKAAFYNHQGILTVVSPGYLDKHPNAPLDLSVVGAGLYYDYVSRGQLSGGGLDLVKTAILERGRLVGVRHRDKSLVIDYFSDKTLTSRFRLVLDESRDFVPLRIETIVLDEERKAWREEQATETTWTRVADIWLPEEVKSRLTAPPRQLSLRFQWLSVNEPLDETLFAKESITLPKGTYIADQTIKPDRSVLVEVVGRPTGADYMDLRDRAKSRGRRFWLLTGNVGALVLAVSLVYWNRWRHRVVPAGQ